MGALRALVERGIAPDLLVGTSIGAWNAAVFGQDPTIAGIERLEAIWRPLTPALVMLGREPSHRAPPQAVNAALMLAAAQRVAGGQASLYGDAGARLLSAQHLGERTFEELPLPVRIIATNITSGTRAIFSSGPLAPVVIASAAIPGIFPPVTIGDQVYVDGGALDNLNADVAVQLGARRLFLLDVGYDEQAAGDAYWTATFGSGKDHRSSRSGGGAHPLAALLERTSQVASRYHGDAALARIPRGVETHLLRLSTGKSEGALAFGKATEWMAAGYHACVDYLDACCPLPAPTPLTVRSQST